MKYNYFFKKGKKDTCPNCGHNTFVRYCYSNGEDVGSIYGRCDRENNCGYFLYPKKDVLKKDLDCCNIMDKPIYRSICMSGEISFFTPRRSVLFNYFSEIFPKISNEKMYSYFIDNRTFSDYYGNTIFFQIDEKMQIRTAKVIPYGIDGHRRKDTTSPCWWLHPKNEFTLKQCFFGAQFAYNQGFEKYDNIYLVESEKTSLFFNILAKEKNEKSIYIATGGSNLLTVEKMQIFNGFRDKVTLIPDHLQEDKWIKWATAMNMKLISSLDFFEIKEIDLPNGYDIMDIYLKINKL